MIEVELVYGTADRQQLVSLSVPEGTRGRELVIDTIERSVIVVETDLLDSATVPIGVYGQLIDDDYQLRPGDRLEIYRPLRQKPMERRRQRAAADRKP
ncbi:MAG: RnfH family protein [Granulosicoccus sp.]|nr:RnfH family protein [Granulosicoccus sp.]